MEWNERNSQSFIYQGNYHVPERELWWQLIGELMPAAFAPLRVLELGCGEGLLAAAILERHPAARVLALDGSDMMRERAAARLARYGERARVGAFTLEADDWRAPDRTQEAIVSSLALHHLHPPEQWRLYRDLCRMLVPGGVVIIADLVAPAGERARRVAADAWDEAVRRRALAIDGHEAVYERFLAGEYNIFRHPDPMDRPAPIREHLRALAEAGFDEIDVYWLQAGHAIFGGRRPPG